MKPNDRLPEPLEPTSTIVAFLSNDLDECGVATLDDREGLLLGDSRRIEGSKRRSVCVLTRDIAFVASTSAVG